MAVMLPNTESQPGRVLLDICHRVNAIESALAASRRISGTNQNQSKNAIIGIFKGTVIAACLHCTAPGQQRPDRRCNATTLHADLVRRLIIE